MIRMLGNGRVEAYCFDGINRLCHIRGKLRKKASEGGLESQAGDLALGIVWLVNGWSVFGNTTYRLIMCGFLYNMQCQVI